MNGKIFSALTGRTSTKSKVQNDLLEQKYIDLLTTFDRIQLRPGIEAAFADHLDKISDLFEQEHNWDNASALEQMLAPLYNEMELDIEMRQSLVEAQRRLLAEEVDFFNDEYALLQESCRTENTINGKLTLLCNLYKKLQISYDLEEKKKYLLSSIRLSTSIAFFISIFIFFLFDNMQLLDSAAQIFHVGEGVPLVPTDKTEFTIAAFTAGWMGSCFSMLLRMKGDLRMQSLSELAAINRLDNLISRSLIGMVSGMLILYSFEGEFLQGSLFPAVTFDDMGYYSTELVDWNRDKAHAMLVFWCFLAGFSEKMVPDLLSRAEKQVAELN